MVVLVFMFILVRGLLLWYVVWSVLIFEVMVFKFLVIVFVGSIVVVRLVKDFFILFNVVNGFCLLRFLVFLRFIVLFIILVRCW